MSVSIPGEARNRQEAVGARAGLHIPLGSLVALGAGLLAFFALFLLHDVRAIWQAVQGAGWGILLVVTYNVVPLTCYAASWYGLIGARGRPPFAAIWRWRWISQSVNSLMPVAQIGGEIVRIRLAARAGAPLSAAGGAVTVDVAAGMLTQVAFSVMGLAALALAARGPAAEIETLFAAGALGAAVFGLLTLLLIHLQRAGKFIRLARPAALILPRTQRAGLARAMARIDDEIGAIHRRRRAFLRACAWRMAGWLAGTGEIWLAAYFIGYPLGFAEALAIEALLHAIRTAAFFLPAGLGVQEGGMLLLGAALGMPAETALGVALLRRVREFTVGAPGLVAWQAEESISLWRGARDGAVTDRDDGTPLDDEPPLKVAVLVDLERGPGAGGHVKSWERLAEAAARRDDLDLTLYVQGPAEAVHRLSPNARIHVHRPVLSTRRFGFLNTGADHTDLAPFHPGLVVPLWRSDVIHTTDAFFAYAKTARLVVRLRPGVALVTSVHTDVPGYTRIYGERALDRLLGANTRLRKVIARLSIPDRMARYLTGRLARHQARARRVLLSERDWASAGGASAVLRRGIDSARFHPSRRDRARLCQQFAIAPESLVLAFAGRIDIGKEIHTLARAMRILQDRGESLHAIIAGAGPQSGAIGQMLGDSVSLPGVVDQDTLAWILASADMFVFPSRVEIAPNVVLEAKASGLPALVAPSGGGVYVAQHGVDGVIIGSNDPADWADEIAKLAADPGKRARIGAAARADLEARHPSWDQVLAEDLLPVWRDAAAEAWRAAASVGKGQGRKASKHKGCGR